MITSIFDLLSNTPASFVYHLTIAFILITTLQLIFWNPRNDKNTFRAILSISVVLAAQILLFAINGLIWQGFTGLSTIQPILDRFILALGVSWLTWIWCFPQENKEGRIALISANVIIVLLALFTGISWANSEFTSFNLTWFDFTWVLFMIIIILGGIIYLGVYRKSYWEFGFSFLLLQFIGLILHFSTADPNQNVSGAIRLSQIAAYPLLPVITRRYLVSLAGVSSAAVEVGKTGEIAPEKDRRRFRADPKILNTWLQLSRQSRPEDIITVMSRAVAQSMNIDICFITNVINEFKQLSILGGFDLVREKPVAGTDLPVDRVNLLSSAITNGKPFWFSPQNAPLSSDLQTIQSKLNLEDLESMLVIPLSHNQKILGSVCLLSPYSNRTWSDEDLAYISKLSDQMGKVLALAYEKSSASVQAEILAEQLMDAQEEIQDLRQENYQLENRLNEITDTRGAFKATQQLDEFSQFQEESKTTIEKLQQEITRLESELIQQSSRGVTATDEAYLQIEEELRLTLEEVARLQNDLAEANIKLITYEQVSNQPQGIDEEEREVVKSIIQEIRQPMSSILGYTDLLLGESVGALGDLQKKFLERIKASNDRMRTLLDELLHVTDYPQQQLDLSPESIDLGEIIDHAVRVTSALLQEKDISLQFEIPDELPQIVVDGDAFQQVLIHLLQNAGNATPNNGQVTMQITVNESEYQEKLLQIMVADTGGGIPDDQLENVFDRRYKAETPLIPGLGDTGVSLSIAKTLVEAQNGAIWVETNPDQGSQFFVTLPFKSELVE